MTKEDSRLIVIDTVRGRCNFNASGAPTGSRKRVSYLVFQASFLH